MHAFSGDAGFSPAHPLGYTKMATIVSWIAAASAVALYIASRPSLSWQSLTGSALAPDAAGICAMHFIGTAALDIAPRIVWSPWLVAASVAITIGASVPSLGVFFWIRRDNIQHCPDHLSETMTHAYGDRDLIFGR